MAAETAAPAPARQKLSLWALAALLCSICIVCPIAPALGLVLGTVAVFDVRRKNRRGLRMAVAALIVGVLSMAGWGLLAGWWNTHARGPMLFGPVEAIASGQRGDIAGFRAAFLPDADADADRDAIDFIAAVTERYGRLVASSQRVDDSEPATTLRRAAIPYEFMFESGPIDAEAEFVLSRDDGGGLVLKFAWVVIRDPVAGDLRYPPGDPP